MTTCSSAGIKKPDPKAGHNHTHGVDARGDHWLAGGRHSSHLLAGTSDERPINVVVELFAPDLAIRQRLDLRALLGRDRPLASEPLVDETLRHAEFFGERGLAHLVFGEVVGEVHTEILAPLVAKSRAPLVDRLNSIATLTDMKKPAATIENDQQTAEARRLAELFKEKSGGMSQEEFGARYNIGTQGMMWQLLNGRRPLNLKAAVGFAQGLNVPLEEVSKTIAEEVRCAAQLLADLTATDKPGNAASVELEPSLHPALTPPEYVQGALSAVIEAYEAGVSREVFDAICVILSLLPRASGANIKPSHKEAHEEASPKHSASKNIDARAAWEEQEAERALKGRGGDSRGSGTAGDRKRKGARH